MKDTIQIQLPPQKMSLEQQRLFVLEWIEKIDLTKKTIESDIRHGDIRNRREKRENYSLWRERAKRTVSYYNLKRQKYNNLLKTINRQIKFAQSTPLHEAKCFVAVAQDILDPETFNQISTAAKSSRRSLPH